MCSIIGWLVVVLIVGCSLLNWAMGWLLTVRTMLFVCRLMVVVGSCGVMFETWGGTGLGLCMICLAFLWCMA